MYSTTGTHSLLHSINVQLQGVVILGSFLVLVVLSLLKFGETEQKGENDHANETGTGTYDPNELISEIRTVFEPRPLSTYDATCPEVS